MRKPARRGLTSVLGTSPSGTIPQDQVTTQLRILEFWTPELVIAGRTELKNWYRDWYHGNREPSEPRICRFQVLKSDYFTLCLTCTHNSYSKRGCCNLTLAEFVGEEVLTSDVVESDKVLDGQHVLGTTVADQGIEGENIGDHELEEQAI
jgi:hypothetical protein